jgi:phospholipase C
MSVVAARGSAEQLAAHTRRVRSANGWDADSLPRAYPPFEHVILIIKENRTYDQVLSDLPGGDGDSTLQFFPRSNTPNHHALAERFGLFDRFFVNAEVSAQGHPWSTSAYVTEYIEKTAPLVYADKRNEVDEAGEVDTPAAGWLWSSALRKGLLVRNYGEYGTPAPGSGLGGAPLRYTSTMPELGAITSPDYPPFNMKIPDQRRVDVWIRELEGFVAAGRMPALEIMHLPGDHLAATRPGFCTPRACMADNDLALGRLTEALSRSPFWKSTVVFVLEDDAQAGPDHVDAHRSVLLAISPYSRAGGIHRFVNTTDVLATIEDILGLSALSQFDRYGRPLRGIWRGTPDLSPYRAQVPGQSMTELNTADAIDARASRRFDLAEADRIDDAAYNRILWRAIKGPAMPYPGSRRMSVLDVARGR